MVYVTYPELVQNRIKYIYKYLYTNKNKQKQMERHRIHKFNLLRSTNGQ